MSGKREAWTPERRTQQGEDMRARWARGDFADRVAPTISDEERDKRSMRMKALNERMRTDPSLKGANLAGLQRSYLSGERQIILAEQMKETMVRPELRELAREHCRKPGGGERTRKGWRTRRLNLARAKLEARA